VPKKLPHMTDALRWKMLMIFIDEPNPEEITLAKVNVTPGVCVKCQGTGTFKWKEDGEDKQGRCFSCRGMGRQSKKQILKNTYYNQFETTRRQNTSPLPLRATLPVDAKRTLHLQKLGNKIIIDVILNGES
jgi:hypothetical protein